jgi:glycosyltransferase involved in cell wall biosynthesis
MVSGQMGTSTALVHHWLVATRGGERVLEALAELFPSADLFTLVCDKSKIAESLRSRHVRSSLLQNLPGARSWYRYYLPLFPFATERMNLSGYDLIISSDAATVKGVRTGAATTHICYCHTPIRYVWNGYETYYRTAGWVSRQALRMVRKRLCDWDYDAAQRVTLFVANSRNVQKRIKECYERESCVIYPPIDTERFSLAPARFTQHEKFFLVVSRLVPYKGIDLLIEAFNKSRRPLVIIGDGPERQKLESRAGPTIRFLGSQSDVAVVQAMQQCSAFVFAGEEDFGMVMAEAQACGKPVIALGCGGAAEIVIPGITGILFDEPSVASLTEALERFDRAAFDPHAIRNNSLRFGREHFLREFSDLVSRAMGPEKLPS